MTLSATDWRAVAADLVRELEEANTEGPRDTDVVLAMYGQRHPAAPVQTVYGVETGLYSDRVLHCVFDAEDLARQYGDSVNQRMREAEDRQWGEGYAGPHPFDYRIREIQRWSVVPVVPELPEWAREGDVSDYRPRPRA